MRYKPDPYQQYGIQQILQKDNLALWWDMGLGKSVVALTAINELKYNRLAIKKVLVIAPKKVAEATWNREQEKWDHLELLRLSNVLGSQEKRIKALCTPADVYIINRENVQWLVDRYRNHWPFDMVVIDEASSFKNHRAKRTKALASVRPHIKRMVQLTGTPAPNGLLDLWSQVWLLDQGERLGGRITQFRERYFNSHGNPQMGFVKYEAKPDAQDTIEKKLADICMSLKAEDYITLPDLTYDVIPVVLTPQAQKQYQELERDMLIEVNDTTTIDVASAAALSNKLCQLCNGAVYDEDRGVHEIHKCKLEAFQETVEALNGAPVMVFYNFKHDIPRIQKVLAKLKRPDGKPLVVRKLESKAEEMAWNRREIDVLLAHPASAAYGLNLQDGGNHVIWFGLNWSLELYLQANKRLHRRGQTQKVIVHILAVEGGRDMDVLRALERKDEGQETLLRSLKARIAEIQKSQK
jgi:SNF2 family DNA or RNA helicase